MKKNEKNGFKLSVFWPRTKEKLSVYQAQGNLWACFFIFIFPFLVTPHFQDPFNGTKWVALFCFSLLFGAKALVSIRSLPLPLFSPIFKFAITGVFLLNTIWLITTTTSLISFESARTFCWPILVLSFFWFFKYGGKLEKISTAFILSLLVWLIFYFMQIFPSSLKNLFNTQSYTFGNINMAAQFIGISTLMATVKLSYKPHYKNLFIGLILLLSVSTLAVVGCRSVTLGVFLALICLIVYEFKKRVSLQKRLPAFIVLACFICSILGSPYIARIHKKWGLPIQQRTYDILDNYSILKGRRNSYIERFNLWEASFLIFKDHPLGIKRGNFGFQEAAYRQKAQFWRKKQKIKMPYDEALAYTPHNTYFWTLAEEGIIYLIFIVVAWVSLFSELFKRWESYKVEYFKPVIVFFPFLFSETMTQFPFATPYPYFISAIMLGYVIYLISLKSSKAILPRSAYFGIYSVFSIIAILFIGVKYVEANHPTDPELLGASCRLSPQSWKVCVLASKAMANVGNVRGAEGYYLWSLKHNPLNFVALRELGFLHLNLGQKQKGCKYIHQHHKLLGDHTNLQNSPAGKTCLSS